MSDETHDEPEVPSYTITAERTFEEDFSEQQLAALVGRTNADTPEDAIAELIGGREADSIQPTQKLLNIDVTVDGPSDD